MIDIQGITDPASKILALRNLADELATRPDCKTAHRITLQNIRKMELRLETAGRSK